jgi:hypothetical protein
MEPAKEQSVKVQSWNEWDPLSTSSLGGRMGPWCGARAQKTKLAGQGFTEIRPYPKKATDHAMNS